MTTQDNEEVEEDQENEIEDNISVEFIPPSIPGKDQLDPNESSTFVTEIPKEIFNDLKQPCILGVDEAGRGPVIGPMVYALSYCTKGFQTDLKNIGFADSKTLNATTRSKYLERICTEEALKNNIGWATTIMTARDIGSGMLKPENHGVYNLNAQAHDTTMELIDRILKLGVNITEIYVDTVGPPVKYQDKLSNRFPGIKITVAKKADSIYPIVSAASICAKVTRDASLVLNDLSGGTWGSGYPADSRTTNWLKSNTDKVFGWGHMVRYSWNTSKDLLDKSGVQVEWTDDFVKKNKKITRFMQQQNDDDDEPANKYNMISTRWYGKSVNFI